MKGNSHKHLSHWTAQRMWCKGLCTHSWEWTKIRGRTIKCANSPPCACRGSTGQKP